MIQVVDDSAGIHEDGATFYQATIATVNGGTVDTFTRHDEVARALTIEVVVNDPTGHRLRFEVKVPDYLG